MIRGTTPTVRIKVAADLSNCNEIHIAFRNNKNVIVKSFPDDVKRSQYADGFTMLSTTLTQEDTLSFKAGRSLEAQVRFRMGDSAGGVEYFTLVDEVSDILEDGEI